MNKFFLGLAFIFATSSTLFSQTTYSLFKVIEQAKNQSISSKAAETRKENFYWQYRSYKANYNPSLNLIGSLPEYNRDFFDVRQENGEVLFLSREQINPNLRLALEQPLWFSGGQISVNSRLSQFNDLEREVTQWNNTLVNVQLVQPIFGFNQLAWDKKTEPLRYEESKRSYVEEMEFISRRSTELFFTYLDAQINLQIAKFNLANNDTIYNIEKGRYNIGTTSKDKLLQVELQLLRSQQDVAQAQLDLQTSNLSMRSYIGLREAIDISLLLPEKLPDFDIELDKAIGLAEQNRADFIEYERLRIEADRNLAQAKAQRFQTNLVASFGYNNAGTSLDETYNRPNSQQRINVTLNVPIIDWGRSKSRVQTAIANQQLTQYTIDQQRQNFEQEIITQVSQFDVLRLQVEITKKSDEVAQERYQVAQNRYLIGKIDITNLNIALTEKDNARRSYINALRTFWIAYFDLRRLTLYDFSNNELLYQQKD
ncbi:MAG: TolC family protein [Cyclobacteriaceae bacterium]